MTNLLEKIFGKKTRKTKTSLHSITGQTVEALSYAYKVDESTVKSIVNDWMRFERAVRDGIYD